MPTCITCLSDKPAAAFNAEHVLTRAFVGQGANWTLIDTVCTSCNSKLSKFEAHWTRSAIEAMMRNFSGPQGRKNKNAGARAQPVEIDDLYLVQIDDPLVYEAGFAFPADFYLRPQVIDTPNGLLGVVENADGQAALSAAMATLFATPTVTVVEQMPNGPSHGYRLTPITVGPRKTNRIGVPQLSNAPSGVWLRTLAPEAVVKDMEGTPRSLTTRLALDDRERLYFRATDVRAVASFLDGFHKPQASPTPRVYAPGEQTIRMRLRIKLPLVFRCVLKTGLNLVAHACGAETARHAAFNPLRACLFDEKADAAVLRRCSFLPACASWPSNWGFPKPGDEYQHRMMLDVWRGKVRFRLRLFGHLGYVAVLADAMPDLAKILSTRRAVVDFTAGGARAVDAWP